MRKILQDFVSSEPRQYKLKIGRSVASSLTGFIVGVVCASIIWITGINNFF